MTEPFEPKTEQTLYPQFLIDGYRALLERRRLKVEDVELSEEEERRLQIIRRRIIWQDKNKGIGYLSASARHEKKAADFIARCFQERNVTPLVVPIDNFYKFIPGNPSLVSKTLIFNDMAQEMNPGEEFAIILTGFSDSKIFTQNVLDQVPTQENAGLNISATTPLGKDLMFFARKKLPLLIGTKKGDLNEVIREIVQTTDSPEEDVRLLLVTGLLLQDRQTWQSLWYEEKEKGTPLYIVAPMSFHDAMNRLNMTWGHGGTDYSYRASSSLGNYDEPPLEDGVKLTNYLDQGTSAEEFQRKIEPILARLKKTR